MKKILSVVLFVVAIVMIGSGVYIMNSSKYLFSMALDGVFNYLTDGYTEMSDKLKNSDETEKYKITTNTTVSNDNDEIISLNGDMYMNVLSEKMYVNLDSKLKKEDFVALEGLLDKEKVYIKIKEVMGNFYYTDLTSESSLEIGSTEAENMDYSQLLQLEDNEINLLVKHLKKSILKDLKDSDFKKASETLKIEGKSYKTSKISLGLSEKEASTISKNFLEAINKDNKAIKILQKINKDITKEKIKELLDSFDDQNLSDRDELEISFYIENFTNARRIEFGTLGSEVDSIANSNVLFRIDLLGKDSYIFSVLQGEKEELKLKNERINATQSKITLEMEDYAINATYTSNDKSTVLDMTCLDGGKTLATLSIKNTMLTKDKEYKVDIIVEVPDMEMKFVSNNTVLFNEDVPNIDISGAKDIEEMTDEDKEKFTNFIQEKMEQLGLNTTQEDNIS